MSCPWSRPAQFPDLPDWPAGYFWSAVVQQGHEVIAEAYNHSSQLLRLEDGDPIRLRLQSERLSVRMLPIMQQLTADVWDRVWGEDCYRALTALIAELDQAAISVDAM